MVVEVRVRCENCDEPITVTYVLVRRPSTDKAPRECPVCDDSAAVGKALDKAREAEAGRRPLLLSVRHSAKQPG